MATKNMQPSSVVGVSAIIASAIGFGVWWYTKDAPGAAAATVAIFGALSAMINDNTTDPTSVEQLIKDLAAAIIEKRIQAMMPTIMNDLTKIFHNPVVVMPEPTHMPSSDLPTPNQGV